MSDVAVQIVSTALPNVLATPPSIHIAIGGNGQT